jgi:class 3 adenylate cyclase
MDRRPAPGGAAGMTTTRRLAAILAADVVGYSRLMEQDEADTFARLIAMRFAKLLLVAWVIRGAGSQFPGNCMGRGGDFVRAAARSRW